MDPFQPGCRAIRSVWLIGDLFQLSSQPCLWLTRVGVLRSRSHRIGCTLAAIIPRCGSIVYVNHFGDSKEFLWSLWYGLEPCPSERERECVAGEWYVGEWGLNSANEYVPLCVPIWLFSYLSTCLSACPFIGQRINQSTNLFVYYPPFYLCIHLSAKLCSSLGAHPPSI